MKFNHTKHSAKIFLGAVIALSVSSCDNANSTKVDGDKIRIDASNQEQVVATLFDSIDITTPTLPSHTPLSSSSTLSQLLPNYQSSAAHKKGTVNCAQGGSITYSTDSTTTQYANCMESNTTVNGKIVTLYDAQKGETRYSLSDYSYRDTAKEYQTPNTSYTVTQDGIAYHSSGKTVVGDKIVEFQEYDYTLSVVEKRIDITINGNLKTNLLGNWVKITTHQPIQFSDNTCPSAGEIEVQGEQTSLKISFASDKSAQIFLNNVFHKKLANCSELPTILESITQG